jgi:hypothetical protein
VTDKDEMSIGMGVAAAVKVAVSNTINTVLHPLHTVKVLIGMEQEKTIPEMIRDEEKRMSEKKRQRDLSRA